MRYPTFDPFKISFGVVEHNCYEVLTRETPLTHILKFVYVEHLPYKSMCIYYYSIDKIMY